ncbi:uncharacterized protein LOC144346538 [Saccoglossus kowalevskii]
MVDQCTSLSKMGIKSCALDYQCTQAETFLVDDIDDDMDDEEISDAQEISTLVSLEDVASGKYQVIYAHPEALISTRKGDLLMNNLSKNKHLSCIAIDEAHMILEW